MNQAPAIHSNLPTDGEALRHPWLQIIVLDWWPGWALLLVYRAPAPGLRSHSGRCSGAG